MFAVKLATSGLILLLIAGWLQDLHPAFDSPSHFRLHLAGLLVLASAILLLARCWKWCGLGVVVVLVSVALTRPYLPSIDGNGAAAAKIHSAAEDNAQPDIVRLVQMNVRYNNVRFAKAVEVIKAAKPDIALLQEITRTNEDLLDDLKPELPHQLYCHRQGVGSVAILSRHPFGSANKRQCLWRLGFARAEIVINGVAYDLASYHSRWPWPFSQTRQWRRVQPEFEALQNPLILAGDFNAAPWSAIVQNTARITNTRVAPGLLMTWGLPHAALRPIFSQLLPIDQVMISPQMSFLSRQILADGGSDHYPVLTRIKLR
ncbi:MAG: endonuclease/exonuclease/phosphatase family protein [Rhizobiaceae bacterium]